VVGCRVRVTELYQPETLPDALRAREFTEGTVVEWANEVEQSNEEDRMCRVRFDDGGCEWLMACELTQVKTEIRVSYEGRG